MPIFDAIQELFAGDLVKERYSSPSEKGNATWVVIEIQKGGSFVKLNKSNDGWVFNDNLMLLSRTTKLKDRD
jgi:hypothetical protein